MTPTSLSAAVAVVQRQLEAYNARDLEAFVACYSPGVEVFLFPSGLHRPDFVGTSFRERYRQLFENSPNLRCELIARVPQGRIVIDHERVYGWNGRVEPKMAVALYQVDQGLIQRVWFVEP